MENLSESIVENLIKLKVNADAMIIKEGSLIFTADALTNAFVPKEIMKKDAWTFTGKEVRVSHKLPENDIANLVGHVHKAWFDAESGKLKTKNEIWGHREDLKVLQDQIKNDNTSISVQFIKRTNDEGEITSIYGRELSMTPNPKCTPELGCGIDNSSIIQYEKEEEKNMPNEKEILDRLEKSYQERFVTLEDANKVLTAGFKERGAQIVTLETTITALEDRSASQNEIIKETSDKLSALQTEHDTMLKDNVNIGTLEVRKEIVKLSNITDEKAATAELEKLTKYEKPDLEEQLERLQRVLKITKKTANKQVPALGEETVTNENESAENFAARMNPGLADFLKREKAGRGNPPIGYQHVEGNDVKFVDGGG